MARKKTEAIDKETLKRAKWQGFVNVYLSGAEKQQIRKEVFGADWYFQFIETVTAAGYKLSVSYSEAGGFYSVTLTGQYEGRPNAGVAMSLKHSELDVAFTALWWCLEQAGLNGDWAERYTLSDGMDW